MSYLDEYGEGYDAVRTIEGLAVSAVELRIESEDLQLPSLKYASLLNFVINWRPRVAGSSLIRRWPARVCSIHFTHVYHTRINIDSVDFSCKLGC